MWENVHYRPRLTGACIRTVKNIPPSLYSLLKQAAEMHHRRINSEIIVCIEKAVRRQRVAVPMLLARAREIRRQIYYVLGQTAEGRYLFCVVFQFPDGNGYPVTA